MQSNGHKTLNELKMKVGKLIMIKRWVVVFVVGSILIRCADKEDAVRDQDVALMADLECQARQLKEERFRAANELRLRGDSLMKANIQLTASQKREEDSLKQSLTQRTGELATRLTFVMDSLFEQQYKTVEQREAFDKALAQRVEESCK